MDFAEIEKFIDTPVKRYPSAWLRASFSGVWVRPAFAMGAHLEPEILSVDEVLAARGGAVRTTQVKGEEPMIALRERIVDKLEYLPESNLRQVLSFVEFLTWRATDQDEPLLSVAGVLSGKMLSAEEIEEELYGDRKEA